MGYIKKKIYHRSSHPDRQWRDLPEAIRVVSKGCFFSSSKPKTNDYLVTFDWPSAGGRTSKLETNVIGIPMGKATV